MDDGARVCKRSMVEEKRENEGEKKVMREGRRERKHGEGEGDWDGGCR